MATVTIHIDLPQGVTVTGYERHGDGHGFEVSWPLPARCRCDCCGREDEAALELTGRAQVVRDLDICGQPSFWVYQSVFHRCPWCNDRQWLVPPFKRKDTTYTNRFEQQVLRLLIGSNEQEVARRLGISPETVGLIVRNQLADVDLHKKRVTFRHGKGGKERVVPLPTPAGQSLEAYLDTRPPVPSPKLFWGQRGPLTTRGVRSLCAKYGKLLGVHLHPHAFRHTMAHRFLDNTSNELVSLAQILGHESLQTTRRYAQRSEQQLADVAEKLNH